MSIKIHNIEELIEKLDFDAQWRKKEIADILLLCKNNNNPPVLLRAAFVLCSAHFEGYIKYACTGTTYLRNAGKGGTGGGKCGKGPILGGFAAGWPRNRGGMSQLF